MAYYDLSYPVLYAREIKAECEKYSLDPALVLAVIKTESDFDERAVSRAGAIGLMQLMPGTAKWCAEVLSVGYAQEKLFDPEYNISLGTFYLSYLANKFSSRDYALAAFNAGEGNVSKWIVNGNGIVFPESREYVKKVNASYKRYIKKVRLSSK